MYTIKALVRMLLFILLLPFVRGWRYAKPQNVGGYLGGIDFRGKTLAFVCGDGRLQFRW